MFLLGALLGSSAHASPDCFAGYYDMGSGAAVVALDCDDGNAKGYLQFCKRETWITKKICTGQNKTMACEWFDPSNEWRCEEGGKYPFSAKLRRVSPDTIDYEFKSSFNSGLLRGALIP